MDSVSSGAGAPQAASLPAPLAGRELSGALTVFFATAVGVIVLNLFCAQPLTGPISAALHLPLAWSGLVAMLPQLGYAAGLMLLVPLVDLLENRRLIVRLLLACAGLLALAGAAASGTVFLGAAFLAGAAASVIQMLVPLAALMACEAKRGEAVGNVMSGLMAGILLSRPLASLMADMAGWRAFYVLMAGLDGVLAVALWRWLPSHRPAGGTGYRALIASLWRLTADEPVLRKHALTAALCMGAFSAFWTAVGLRLAQPPFDFSQRALAVFALAGASGVVITPLAGRAGDRGWTAAGTAAAHLIILAGATLSGMAAAGWFGFMPAVHPALAVGGLAVAAILLDTGVVIDQTLGRRAINLLNPAARGRLNGLFVGMFFVAGALGAVLAGLAWARGGWTAVCGVQLAFGGIALLAHARAALRRR